MESNHQISVPLRSGGKKIRKRRELDALIAHSIGKKRIVRRPTLNGHSQDKLLSASTDDADDYVWMQSKETNNINRCHNRKYVLPRLCKPVMCTMGCFLLTGVLYWLYLDLRQDIYDYGKKIEEVALMNQNLPDTLQKWHETSSFLAKNQTSLNIRASELERTIERLRNNFTKYKTLTDAQQINAKDNKLVADLGAKIEAVVSDVEILKERYTVILNTQKAIQGDIKEIKFNLSELYDRNKNFTFHITSIENNWREYNEKKGEYRSLINDTAVDVENLKINLQKLEHSVSHIGIRCTKCNETNKIQKLEQPQDVDTSTITSVKNAP